LQKFIQPLRGVGLGGIPVASPDATPAPVTGVLHYTIDITEFTDRLHPSLPKATTLWGYNPTIKLGGGGQPQRHLGGIIVAQKGVPLQITFTNKLPNVSIIPEDNFLPGVNTAIKNRTAVHLHGGYVPWISDGGPFDWFDSTTQVGLSFLNNSTLNPAAGAGQAEYYYPNAQSARFMWYHDHAVGITRTNAYKGLATGYIIRDAFETGLVGPSPGKGLPDFVENGGYEIPLVIQDKIFVPPNIAAIDPTWAAALSPGYGLPGDLWYAHVYDPKLYKLTGSKKGKNAPPDPSVVPEFFGDTMLMNGLVYPEATVEARRYRFRLLNACNARFVNLQLYVDDKSADGITLNPLTLAPTNPKGPDFFVIGTEGGFLPKPVLIPSNNPFSPLTLTGSMIMAPAERYDFVVDFSGFAGQKIIVYNDAPAPFPVGSPLNDYFPGAVGNPIVTSPGFGPNTRQIMRFNVVAATSSDPAFALSTATDLSPGNDPLFTAQYPGLGVNANGTVNIPAGLVVAQTRQLTLNESFDANGRLIQMIGTNVPPGSPMAGYGRPYYLGAGAAPTETPLNNTVEIWQIANLTGDTHPIHFHLVNVQILARQTFRVTNYNGTPSYLGTPVIPTGEEAGWKETVRMNPGEVTTVIMKFTLPPIVNADSTITATPVSPRTGGNEYVYHCHILEHEEHDMMRPLVVT
jgi:spore coat protein A